jgi:hypothetical protein
MGASSMASITAVRGNLLLLAPAPFINRGNSISRRNRNDLAASTAEICIGSDYKRIDLLLEYRTKKTPSKSASPLAVKMCICRPRMRAASWTCRVSKLVSGLLGFTSNANRRTIHVVLRRPTRVDGVDKVGDARAVFHIHLGRVVAESSCGFQEQLLI